MYHWAWRVKTNTCSYGVNPSTLSEGPDSNRTNETPPCIRATRPLWAVFNFVKLIGDTYLAVFQTSRVF
jgi:hypothetical protein